MCKTEQGIRHYNIFIYIQQLLFNYELIRPSIFFQISHHSESLDVYMKHQIQIKNNQLYNVPVVCKMKILSLIIYSWTIIIEYKQKQPNSKKLQTKQCLRFFRKCEQHFKKRFLSRKEYQYLFLQALFSCQPKKFSLIPSTIYTYA